MTKEAQKEFVDYWAENRDHLARPASKFIRGLPVAILFTLPIIMSVIVVYIFSPEWYTKVAPKQGGTFPAIFVALFVIVLFISYFRMQYKWESNEDEYQEILRKIKNDAAKTDKK